MHICVCEIESRPICHHAKNVKYVHLKGEKGLITFLQFDVSMVHLSRIGFSTESTLAADRVPANIIVLHVCKETTNCLHVTPIGCNYTIIAH